MAQYRNTEMVMRIRDEGEEKEILCAGVHIGEFFVWRMPKEYRKLHPGYTVTHIPSMRIAGNSIGNKARACECAEELMALDGAENWKCTSPRADSDLIFAASAVVRRYNHTGRNGQLGPK